MTRFYLVRHAESISNTERVFSYKKYDFPLTPKGILQSQQTAEYFKNNPIAHIYSSPLKRGFETANTIASKLNMEVTILEALREVNIGDLEGPPASQEKWNIHNQVVDDWFKGKRDSAPPGGENYHTLYKRTADTLTSIASRHNNENVIIVGHGGMFIFTLKDICYNVDVEYAQTLSSHNCSITIMDAEYENSMLRCKLISWASTDHLNGKAAEFTPGIIQEQDWNP